MRNAISLFWQQAGCTQPKPWSPMAIAVDMVLAGSLQLSLSAAELVERLDALDALIDALDDDEARRALKELTTSYRRELGTSVLALRATIKGLSQS
jgi:hypothetical protein